MESHNKFWGRAVGLEQNLGWGGANQLTLSQPGGQIMPTTVIQAPLDFQTLRQPCTTSYLLVIWEIR